ncbi:hypothetical protein Ocin01_15657 [Orchesella cincta]|uniref:Uncharacterized protein n=1 Tax=Orchesella cincta TaxID=48709 RepID=A0A1D2MDG9_ORCCI|nr:hypothetical protein Ocin01_15657 [Orchesella cincta]
MAVKLCPCMPLEKGVKLLAIIDGIIGITNLLLFSFVLVGLKTHKEEFGLNDEEKQTVGPILIIEMTFSIVQIFMAVKLFDGAKLNDIRKCRTWIIVATILGLMEVCSSLKNGEELNALSFRIFLVAIVYKVYAIFVVLSFTKELAREMPVHSIVNLSATQPVALPEIYNGNQAQHQQVYYTNLECNYQNDKSPPYSSIYNKTETIVP